MKRLLILLLLTTWLAIPVRAEKWALLVGINNYPNDISPLRYCVADVVAFRDALVNVAGFKRDKIFLMTDDMEGQMEPTNINVIMRLGILAKQIQPEDTFVFYFSGHGIVNDGSSFLLAANSNTVTQDTLEMSAVPLDRVSKILSSVKAQQLLTVIDACRNNPETGRSGEDNVLTDDFSKGFKIRRSSSNGGQPSVSATLYACNVAERAYEWSEKGHGVFSYYLLEGLSGEAVNNLGEVTVAGLAEYTQRNVVSWAKEYRGKKQTPWLSLQGGAKLVLATLSQPVDPTLALTAESETWQVVKDSQDITDFEAFLDKFPNGDYALAAKLKLKQLRPKKITWGKDESEMVLIPAGSFEMGDHLDGMKKALPVHTVELDSFYMDKYEVTVGQFKKFVEKSGYAYQGNWNSVAQYSPGDDYPMVYVTWNDAVAYAKWTRKRLPTEAEWEYAARGGLAGKRYPWGDEKTHDNANYAGTGGKDEWGRCAPVGSFKPNGYGLFDVAGNVWEWCADWFAEDYYNNSPTKNPLGPDTGSWRIIRGGSWIGVPIILRVADRYTPTHLSPNERSISYGFRCVSSSLPSNTSATTDPHKSKQQDQTTQVNPTRRPQLYQQTVKVEQNNGMIGQITSEPILDFGFAQSNATNSKIVAYATTSNQVILLPIDLTSKSHKLTPESPIPVTNVKRVAVYDQKLAYVTKGDVIHILNNWEFNPTRPTLTLSPPRRAVADLWFSEENLYVGVIDGTVLVYDSKSMNKRPIHTIGSNHTYIDLIRFNPVRQQFLIYSRGSLSLWNFATRRSIWQTDEIAQSITSVRFSRTGDQVALQSGNQIFVYLTTQVSSLHSDAQAVAVFDGKNDPISAFCFGTRNTLLTIQLSGRVKKWTTSTQSSQGIQQLPKKNYTNIAYLQPSTQSGRSDWYLVTTDKGEIVSYPMTPKRVGRQDKTH